MNRNAGQASRLSQGLAGRQRLPCFRRDCVRKKAALLQGRPAAFSQMQPRLGLAWLCCAMALSSGCSLFLPAHSNSNHRNGERVTLRMLTSEEMDPYGRDYALALGRALPSQDLTAHLAPAVGPLAAAAVGLGLGYVQKEIGREASQYEAQFGYTLAGEGFWRYEAARYAQNYFGFEIKRAVPGDELAFQLVCGIAPSGDGQMFRVAPLQFQTRKAKAKVCSDETGWWLLPTTWLGKAFRRAGHNIDTEVQVEMDGYWRDKDQGLRIVKIAGFNLKFSSYPITDPAPLWTVAEGSLTNAPSGWLLAPPISYDVAGQSVTNGAGTFLLRVVVTERDLSNAKRYLEEAARLVAEQKPAMTEGIKR